MNKVVVIGTGSIGLRHLNILSNLENVLPIALPKRRERITILNEMGFHSAICLDDAVNEGATLGIIASDTGNHLEDGLLALESGLDVLIEKPMGVNKAEAQTLHDKSTHLGRNLYVGCVLRFSEPLNRFKDLLVKIGSVHSISIEAQSYLPDWRPDRSYVESYSARKSEGGVLRDLIHEIDYTGWIFGWPKYISAQLKNSGRLDIESEDIADLNWEGPDGALVCLRLDYLSRTPRRKITANGELGSLTCDLLSQTVLLRLSEESAEEIKSNQTRNHMFRQQAIAFVTGDLKYRNKLANSRSAISALAICDASRLSSQYGKQILVEYV